MTRTEEAITTLSDISKAYRNFSQDEITAIEIGVKALKAIDKIRAEIEKDMLYYADVRNKDSEKWCVAKRSGLNRALEIIDSTVRKALK